MKFKSRLRKEHLFHIARLISGEGGKWLLWSTVSAILLTLIEYGLAGLLQLIMVNIGLVDSKQIEGVGFIDFHFNFFQLILILIILGLIKSVGLYFSNQSSVVFNQLVNARMRLLTAYELLLGQEEFISASQVHTRFGEVYPKAGTYLLQVNTFIVYALQACMLLGGLFFLAWREAVLSLFGLFIVGVCTLFISRRIISSSSGMASEQQRIAENVERVTRNWLFVRISGNQKHEYVRLKTGIFSYFRLNTTSSMYATINSIIPSFFGVIIIAGLLYVSHEILGTKAVIIVSFLYLFMRFVQQLSVAVSVFSNSLTLWPHFKIVLQILDRTPRETQSICWSNETLTDQISEKNRRISEATAPKIEVENLTFFYPEMITPVLKNINFKIQAGEFFAVIGPSGCGKSTLLLLILQLLKPNSGKIKYEGDEDLEFVKNKNTRIGYVGAEPFLIDGTVRENLLYGINGVVSDEDIWLALKNAHIDDVVRGLNGQLNWHLNENGMGLSAGQKQRISLARALIKKPLLLILDEATANLDRDTEELVAKTLDGLKGKCTIIAVSHREGLIQTADHVFDFKSMGARKIENSKA